MFSQDRFNLSRFSLGSGENICLIEQTFTEKLNSVAGMAIPVETDAFFNDVVRGRARGAIAVRSSFDSFGVLNADAEMHANIYTAFQSEEALSAKVVGSQNKNITETILAALHGTSWGSKNLIKAFSFKDALDMKVDGVKNIQTSQLIYEVLTAVAGAYKQSTEIASIAISIPPGAELRIDSDTFRVTLNGENILYAQSGDWIRLSRDLLYLDVESASGGTLEGNMIYTERYL